MVVLVCKEHLKKGLQLLPVPHVQEVKEGSNECCEFCQKKAVLKLFIFQNENVKEFEMTMK